MILFSQPYITGSPLTSKKIAPEPPRRHCSIRNSRTLSQDGTQISQHSAANMFYGPGGTPLHSHNVYLQQQQQQQVTNQPIYANYATIQQTTAEIHCEKFHDNKVSYYFGPKIKIRFLVQMSCEIITKGEISVTILKRRLFCIYSVFQRKGNAKE